MFYGQGVNDGCLKSKHLNQNIHNFISHLLFIFYGFIDVMCS